MPTFTSRTAGSAASARDIVGGLNGSRPGSADAPLLDADALDWLTFPYTGQTTGIVLVLIFVGLPFVVRTVQPVLQEWDPEYETAARSLGAGPLHDFPSRDLSRNCCRPGSRASPSPSRAPSANMARSSSSPRNIPGKSQIAPLQIVTKLDDFQYARPRLRSAWFCSRFRSRSSSPSMVSKPSRAATNARPDTVRGSKPMAGVPATKIPLNAISRIGPRRKTASSAGAS